MALAPFVFPSFLRVLAASLLAGVAAVVVFVAVVDPYRLYGLVDRAGFNRVKPGLTRYQFQIKEAHAVARRPRVVILGNSRAEIGLDPAAPALAAAGGAVYNLAIPGTGIATSTQQLAGLAKAQVKLDTVIAGVEFIDFLRPAIDAPARAAAHAPAPARGPALWRIDALFSLTSVIDGARTLQIQRSDEASVMTAQGFNPLHEYRRFVRDDGYYAIFRQRAQESAASLRTKSTSAFDESGFPALRSFLDTAADSGADIKLLIYPYHAQMLALFESSGLWPLFEQWKRGVIGEVAALRRRRPGVRVDLVDFSGFGAYNCEAIPAAGQHAAETIWYWEAGHFKKALGDVVLRRLVTGAAGGASDQAFGTPLDGASEALNRARIATERTSCVAAHPEIFSDARRYAGRRP
jgi:hypothetical protein